MYICISGDLGELGGRSPQKMRWGTAHASVPQIFGEVVLLEASESSKREKRCEGEIVLMKIDVFR